MTWTAAPMRVTKSLKGVAPSQILLGSSSVGQSAYTFPNSIAAGIPIVLSPHSKRRIRPTTKEKTLPYVLANSQ